MLMDKINDILNSHGAETSMKALCQFVRDHMEEIPDMTIDEIALQCHLSKSQVSKCVRALNYADYKDFKLECAGYRSVVQRRKKFFDPQLDFVTNSQAFLEMVYQTTYDALPKVENDLGELKKQILGASMIYLFARGDARSLCHKMQWVFRTKEIRCTLCDAEFKEHYEFGQNDMLIHISINGDSFFFEPRIMHRIKTAPVRKWLLTCRKEMDGYDRILYIPTDEGSVNEYVMRNIIDLLLIDLT